MKFEEFKTRSRGAGLEIIKVTEFLTLRDAIIASFQRNGPMTREELYRSLPHFTTAYIDRALRTLPIVKRGEYLELKEIGDR